MAVKRNDNKRRVEIIKQLSDLSRNGWVNARPCDYQPFEAELRKLEGQSNGIRET